jgi:hypothetical protein
LQEVWEELVNHFRPVPAGKYSVTVKGWGERQLEVKGWQRGKINRPGLFFSRHKNCLLLVLVAN